VFTRVEKVQQKRITDELSFYTVEYLYTYVCMYKKIQTVPPEPTLFSSLNCGTMQERKILSDLKVF
jgi:hypothetical protein